MRRPSSRRLRGKGALGEFDIARLAVVDALGAADLRRCARPCFQAAVHQRLDLSLHLVGQLLAVGAEELDAIVLDRDCARR